MMLAMGRVSLLVVVVLVLICGGIEPDAPDRASTGVVDRSEAAE
jgi:hypothetical protein